MQLQEGNGQGTIRLVQMPRKYISSHGVLDLSQICGNRMGRIKLLLTLLPYLGFLQWDKPLWEGRCPPRMRMGP